METVRVFIACRLDADATERVVSIQRALRRAADAQGWRASWVPSSNLHVTLKFLGETDADHVALIDEQLRAVASAHGRVRLHMRGLAGFPQRGPPRVLGISLEDSTKTLGTIVRAIDAAMASLGFAPEARPFHPHITLARVRDCPRRAPLSGLEASVGSIDAGDAAAREIILFRSDLRRSGAEYRVLAEHPLTGASEDSSTGAGSSVDSRADQDKV